MKIEDSLTRPEGKTLEFKRNLSSAQNTLKTVAAFASAEHRPELPGTFQVACHESCQQGWQGVAGLLKRENA